MGVLFNESPLTVNVELAKLIGLNESIVLQQIQYWLKINEKAGRNFRDGYYWTYNTFEEWQEQFPFWSLSTIKRIFAKLEKKNISSSGITISSKLTVPNGTELTMNCLKPRQNRQSVKMTRWTCQNGLMESVKMNRPLPETIQRIQQRLTVIRDFCLTEKPKR